MTLARWSVGALLAVGACASSATESPLATYEGESGGAEAFYAQGTLAAPGGCPAIEVTEDGDTFAAMLRLPSDGAADAAWTDERLRFHGSTYSIGDALIFRATAVPVVELEDLPPPCQDADLELAVSPTSGIRSLRADPSPTVLGGGDQPHAAVAGLSNGGMDAAMTAPLAVVAERCLGVADPQGPGTLLVWPFGTTMSDDADPQVTLPDGSTYRVGDQLDLGGGFTYEPGSGDADRPVIDGLPAECQDLARFEVAP